MRQLAHLSASTVAVTAESVRLDDYHVAATCSPTSSDPGVTWRPL